MLPNQLARGKGAQVSWPVARGNAGKSGAHKGRVKNMRAAIFAVRTFICVEASRMFDLPSELLLRLLVQFIQYPSSE